MIRLSCLSLLLFPALVACSGDKDAPADDTGADDSGDTDSGDTDSGDTDSGDTDTADTDSGDTAAPADIALAGDWYDNWGGQHTVTNDAWSAYGSSYAITRYDNDAGFAIAQNGAENAWNPNLWSRFDWGWSDGELVYCQTAYAAESEDAALATPAADLTNPTSGCNGFSWTVLRAPFSLVDGWDDAWGGEHVIDPFTWWNGASSYAIARIDDANSWLVAQNAATNDWNPGLWSRFDWTWDAEGAAYYCQTAYAAESEDAAVATPAADAGDLAAGCGGFSWTEIRPMLSIGGVWTDAWGGSHFIDAFAWRYEFTVYSVTEANDAEGWLVAQNAATNEWNPGLWSRFDWTWDGDGLLWYCQTAYAAESEEAARATPAADPADPGTTGCGGFSWTSMSPAAAR
jgi:hypothetical protein